MRMADPAATLLAGVRVIELTSYIAAPSAGLALAQLGADVIRIEPMGGGADRSRWPLAPGGTSLYWTGLNRGKRAVALDLSASEAGQIVRDLVVSGGSEGGIVITNVRPGLGYGYDDLVASREDLIHVQLSGRAGGGTAVDYTVNASSGFGLITGPTAVSEPVNPVVPAWDLLAGMYIATGVLAAMHGRSANGRGARLELALEDVPLAIAGNLGLLAEAELAPQPRGRIGNDVYGDFGREFRTQDGHYVMLVVLTERHWEDLVALLELGAEIDALERRLDVDFRVSVERYRHRSLLADLVRRWFATQSLAEVETVLSGSTLLWEPYISFQDVVTSGRFAHHPMIHRVDHPGSPPVIASATPLTIDGARHPVEAAPRVGEHNEEILKGILGYDDAQVERLTAHGVVGSDVDPVAARWRVSAAMRRS